MSKSSSKTVIIASLAAIVIAAIGIGVFVSAKNRQDTLENSSIDSTPENSFTLQQVGSITTEQIINQSSVLSFQKNGSTFYRYNFPVRFENREVRINLSTYVNDGVDNFPSTHLVQGGPFFPMIWFDSNNEACDFISLNSDKNLRQVTRFVLNDGIGEADPFANHFGYQAAPGTKIDKIYFYKIIQ